MTTYVLLLTGDETPWEQADAETRAAIYRQHADFAAALEARGHRITGGAELTHSRQARVVRRVAGQTVVTEGPYAEATEQLAGFYLVESEDLEDLLDCVALLPGAETGVEVRATVAGDPGRDPA